MSTRTWLNDDRTGEWGEASRSQLREIEAALLEVPTPTSTSLGSIPDPVMPAPIGPELWVTSNFHAGYNVTDLAPSLTGDGTNKTTRTLVYLGNLVNRDVCFRVSLDVTHTAEVGGWASVALSIVDNSGAIVAGTDKQQVATTNLNTKPFQMDFKSGDWGTDAWLDVTVQVYNNSHSGLVGISNVSVQEIAGVQRPMGVAAPGSGVFPSVFTRLFDPVSGTWRMTRTEIQTAGSATTDYLSLVTAFNSDAVFHTAAPDPTFVATDVGPFNVAQTSVIDALSAPLTSRVLRVGNNDQVIEVLKQDGVTYELRCNTHGGETLRSSVAPDLLLEIDDGTGTWTTWDGTGIYFNNYARRFRYGFNTKIARSAPDSDVFANVDHVATWFPDGMMRMDRTTTFVKAVRIGYLFEWMSSHSTTVPLIGRIGQGLTVLDNVDTYPKVAVPASPTLGTAAVGGTLAAATYAYTVTALAAGGETTAPTYATQATTGSTSTVTVNWVAVTSATGYRVYGRINGVGNQTLLATLGKGVTSWIDDGSVAQTGTQPPQANTARILSSASVAYDSAVSGDAEWAVWYDQFTNMCFGNIYDRTAVLARPGISGVKTRLEAGAGIVKNYLNLYWDGTDGSPHTPGSNTHLTEAGETWTATHWAYCYVPADPANYHQEIMLRAVQSPLLTDLYPAD